MDDKELDLLNLVINNLKALIWFMKDEHTIGGVNDAFSNFMGKNTEYYTNRSIYEVLPTSFSHTIIASNQKVYRGEVVYFEEFEINKNQEERLLAITKTPVYELNGKIKYIICSADDITEKRILETKTRNENLKLAEEIVQTLRDPILVLDGKLKVISTNQAFCSVFKVSKETTIGQYLYDLGNGEWQIPSLRKLLGEILPLKNEVIDYKVEHDFSSLGHCIMLINARRIINKNSPSELILLSIENVTKRIEIEKTLESISSELFLQKELAQATLLSIGDGFISTDINGRIFELNSISIKLTGYSKEEAIGKPFEEIFKIVNEKTREIDENPVKKVIRTGKPTTLEKDAVLLSKDGTEYFVEDSAAPIMTESGEICGVVFIFKDITSLKIQIRENEYIGLHDYLTNLYNRRYFVKELERLDKIAYYPLGIMMMDMNGLKIYNDAFGHVVGDSVLISIANVLTDTFNGNNNVFRIGGDEFAAIVPNCSDEQMESFVIRIHEALEEILIENIPLSLAVGYDIKQNKQRNIEDVIKFAENNMYKYKLTTGRSTRNNAIKAILKTLTNKYDAERIHSERVSDLCVKIGKELNVEAEALQELKMAGLYHDIGKISIPDSILYKPGKLTADEYDIIKTHTEIGYQILRAADEYSNLAIYAYSHHERWDGHGYPKGIKGLDVPLFSRIIGIADAYEAMTSDRPYRKKMSKKDAVAEIIRCSGSQFDPTIAELFLKKILKVKTV